jgi:hypothetical protein
MQRLGSAPFRKKHTSFALCLTAPKFAVKELIANIALDGVETDSPLVEILGPLLTAQIRFQFSL